MQNKRQATSNKKLFFKACAVLALTREGLFDAIQTKEDSNSNHWPTASM